MDNMTNSSTSTPWFGVATGLIGLIVGYGLSASLGGGSLAQVAPTPPAAPSAPAVADEPEVTADPATVDDDAVLGSASATVTVIEFTDYQCPFCSRHYNDTQKQIVTNYVDTGKVKYVVRDYPLSFHPNAHKAAEAAECAGEQDEYFAMHDMLFENQDAWSGLGDAVPTFKDYAKQLGLNAASFASCLDNGDMAAEVDADMNDGTTAGISGTPGFWIVSDDGQSKNISGAYPYATFQAAIDAML